MRKIINIMLLYLTIFALIFINLELVYVFPQFGYIIYILIIIMVLFFDRNILWGKEFKHGIGTGIFLIGTIFALELITGRLEIIGIEFEYGTFFYVFIFQLLVAIGEEISFRGYMLKNMIPEIGNMRGIFLTSFLFSGIHIPSILYYQLDISRAFIAFMVIGLVGAIASIMYINFGLKSAIGFHFAWNFIQYNVLGLAKSQPGTLKINYIEQDILTGGNFGPEAGIIGLAIILIFFIYLLKNMQKA